VGDLEDILAHLEPALGPLSGEPVALGGGITNHNFRATLGGMDYVIRRHGRDTSLLGIDRAAERAASKAAALLGIAPAVVSTFEGGLVTRFIPSLAIEAGGVAERVQEIALDLRRFHLCGVSLGVRFWVPDLLEDYARVLRERGVTCPAVYGEAVHAARRIAAVLPLEAALPCHNDLLPGNIIRAHDDGQIMIVDWEYAGMGHPYFDLGNLSVNNHFEPAEDDRLLTAYHAEPPTDARRARLNLMRVLSDAREAAWGVVQAGIAELDFDFEAYGSRHFERLITAVGEPEFGEWLAAA
jgi:thiamine kinase-like enzyme